MGRRWGRRLGLDRSRFSGFLPVLGFFALALVFYGALYKGDPSNLPSALVGQKAPAFILPPLVGLARDVPGFASADLQAGQFSIVNIWASWCGPCRDEHPLLMDLARRVAPGVWIYGLNYKDAAENARRFLGQLGNPYRAVGVDAKGRVGVDWGVYGVPETFVVSPEGIILFKHVGPLSAKIITTQILPLLSGS